MTTDWVPWATPQTWAAYPGGPITGTARKITLHTTESTSFPGYSGGAKAPHLTLNPATGEARQHVPLTRSSRALVSPGQPRSPNINAGQHIQIELIGYAARTPGYPDDWYRRLAGWLHWLCADTGTPRVFPWPFSTSSTAVRQSWDRYAPTSGIMGHGHAPFNDHWDPGRLDTQRLARFMGDLDPTPTPEDELTPDQAAQLREAWHSTTPGEAGVKEAGALYLAVYELTERMARLEATIAAALNPDIPRDE